MPVKLGLVFVAGIIALALSGASLAAPGTFAGPATAPAAGDGPFDASLAHNTIRFRSPDGWQVIESAATDNAAAFAWLDHGSALAVEILPTTATTDAKAAAAIVGQLRGMRRVRKEQFTLEPTIEKDDRFSLRIHERFKSSDASVDQWHLYRKVGPRVVMVTIRAATENEDDLKGAVFAGETTALSVVFGRPPKQKG